MGMCGGGKLFITWVPGSREKGTGVLRWHNFFFSLLFHLDSRHMKWYHPQSARPSPLNWFSLERTSQVYPKARFTCLLSESKFSQVINEGGINHEEWMNVCVSWSQQSWKRARNKGGAGREITGGKRGEHQGKALRFCNSMVGLDGLWMNGLS